MYVKRTPDSAGLKTIVSCYYQEHTLVKGSANLQKVQSQATITSTCHSVKPSVPYTPRQALPGYWEQIC
jgi:hypothetical protein